MYYLEAYKLTRTFPIALEKYLWVTWSTELSKYIQYTYNEVLIYATKFSKHYTSMGMCIYIHFFISKEKNHLTKCKKHFPYSWILTEPPQMQAMRSHTTIHCCSRILIPMSQTNSSTLHTFWSHVALNHHSALLQIYFREQKMRWTIEKPP